MSAADQSACVTAILMALRSEETVTNWARRLPANDRRQVRDRLVRRVDQRAVDLWQTACDLVDSEGKNDRGH